MPKLTLDLYKSLYDALHAHARQTGEPIGHIVERALSDALGLDHATLFQVSTTGAIVQGVYRGAMTLGTLKEHGDFGLGTFDGLDGEMVALDGEFYQVHASGKIEQPRDSTLIPFAVVTNFRPSHRADLPAFATLAGLTAALDRLRRSDNLFFAVRLDGTFVNMHTRAACKAEEGVSLVAATAHQAEFTMNDAKGTIVGFWSPPYARSLNVGGWHLHFLTDDRKGGGHVLGCSGPGMEAAVQDLDDVRLAIPETREFLEADLTLDPTAALNITEKSR
ncbi:MAG: acetolactate decarboxylase [Hyphomicrobiales bacterium]